MRFAFIIFALLIFTGCKDDDPNPDPNPQPDTTFMRGADLSFLPEIETYPITFTDTEGNEKDMLTILKEAGCNTVRLRLWHTPATGHSGLDEVAAFSQRIKAAGLKVYITVHFSDTWADPGQQATPAAWQGLTLAQLRDSVYSYTTRIVTRIKPDYISLGNEINGGILWETGRIDNGSNFFQLLGQAVQATRKASSTTKIIIHYGGLDGAEGFFNQIRTYNIGYDIMGISYYPYWHGKDLSTVQNTLNGLYVEFGKPLLVAETAYPFTLDWADWTNNLIGLEAQLIPEYPATPQGQLDFMLALRTITESIDNGAGFCYWGGDYVAFKGPQAKDGSSWENQALFDFDFHALPVMQVFHE
jgi:arabinogalactan endo-1,4-beta-galactosidase